MPGSFAAGPPPPQLLLLMLLLLLPAPGNGCQVGDLAALFQVAAGKSWVRVRLQMPQGCRLLVDGPGVPPRLYLQGGLHGNSSADRRDELVVARMRKLPDSNRQDLLHTFSGLEVGRQYWVCLTQYHLLPESDASGTKWFSGPSLCSTAETERGAGPTHSDGIMVACLFGMYILGLVLVATIFWRLHICLPRSKQQHQQQQQHLQAAFNQGMSQRASENQKMMAASSSEA